MPFPTTDATDTFQRWAIGQGLFLRRAAPRQVDLFNLDVSSYREAAQTAREIARRWALDVEAGPGPDAGALLGVTYGPIPFRFQERS